MQYVSSRRFGAIVTAAALSLLACTNETTVDPVAVATPTADVDPASPTAIPTSTPERSTAVVVYDDDPTHVSITYTDVADLERTIEAELRVPAEANDRPRAVLVWSHGGAEGRRDASAVGDRWGRAATNAGFAFVAIAHPGRPASEAQQLCETLGGDNCADFPALLWDRPADVIHVLDWVEQVADEFALDPASIVYGGHSAGATSTFNLAGTAWDTGLEVAAPTDDRPIAFLAASSPGATLRGLAPEALEPLERPMLLLTGRGDSARVTTGPDRKATFELFAPGTPHLLLWLDDDRATHSLFNLDTDGCERVGGTRSACRSAARVVMDTAVAWLRHVTATDDPADPLPPHELEQLRRDLPRDAYLLTTTSD